MIKISLEKTLLKKTCFQFIVATELMLVIGLSSVISALWVKTLHSDTDFNITRNPYKIYLLIYISNLYLMHINVSICTKSLS